VLQLIMPTRPDFVKVLLDSPIQKRELHPAHSLEAPIGGATFAGVVVREQLDEEVTAPNVHTMTVDIRRVITLFFAGLCFFDDDCLIPDVSSNRK